MNISLNLRTVARLMPHAPAISFEGRQLSYGAFEHQAACIAGSLLAKRGLTAGDRVAIIMENALEYLPALYGIWRAGLCAVPVDVNLHAREIAQTLSDCDAKLAFVSRGAADRLSGVADADWPAVVITGSRDWMAMLFADPVTSPPIGSEANAWIFYTSAAAGRPKGATLTHRQLQFAMFAYYADIDQLDARDCMLHAAPLCHGAGLYALAHVTKGSHQIIFPSFDPERILETIASREQVSMSAAPAMLGRLMDHASAGETDFSGLKTIICDGEPMRLTHRERAIALFGAKLYHLYGRCESPIITGLSPERLADHHHPDYQGRLASAGLPRTGVAVKIVDDNGDELPLGQVGNIVTSSDCVMTSYWNNPDATRSTLRDGWLWTGDTGSVDAAGFLHFSAAGAYL